MDVALFGAAGYSGLELAKLLAGHPHVRLACAASDAKAGTPLARHTGRDHGGLAFVTTAEAMAIAARCGFALLAVPPEPAKQLTPALREAGVRVIDLSNAHRGVAGAVYGLTSLYAREVADAPLVANPGCYATCVITACAPLVQLVAGDFAVSAGSGVTGAGRTASEEMSLGEMYGEVRAYKVLRHQHVPEIEATLGRCGMPAGARVVLTTHLLPVARGIFATITARLATPQPSAALVERFRALYAGDPSVVVADTPEDVSLRKVVGTNTCMVGVASDDRGAVVVTAALDNLLKGASGQAVENLNVMLGVARTAGLEHLARHA